jgi:F-type H+-transporting ATPase subunit a
MIIVHLSPDEWILFERAGLRLNATVVMTWFIMTLLTLAAWFTTRKISATEPLTRWQNAIEIIVLSILHHLADIGLPNARHYIGFVGTLFLFIATSNIAIVLPLYEPPTGSLSTTAALATCVFLAVPTFGIAHNGFLGYLKGYKEPTILLAPFHIINEISRTVALTVRLFGNVMSGSVIVAILLAIIPLIFPIIMTAIGLITGVVQAYIFSVLSAVYIAAAVRAHKE